MGTHTGIWGCKGFGSLCFSKGSFLRALFMRNILFCGAGGGSPFLETPPQNTLPAKSTQGVGAASPTGAQGWAESPL